MVTIVTTHNLENIGAGVDSSSPLDPLITTTPQVALSEDTHVPKSKTHSKISLYNVGPLAKATLIQIIMKSLPETVHALILNIKHIVKIGSRTRFDLNCPTKDLLTLIVPLRALAKAKGWGVKAYSSEVCSPYIEKIVPFSKPLLPRLTLDQALDSPPFKNPPRGFFSWNVSTLTGHRDEIRWLVQNPFNKPAFLALQETHIGEFGMDFRISGYDMLSNVSVKSQGSSGIALACSKSLTCTEIHGVPGYCILVKCFDYQPHSTWIIGSVYIPHNKQTIPHLRQSVLQNLRLRLQSLSTKYPSMPIMLGGDWNMSSSKLNRLFLEWNLPFGVQRTSGSPITRVSSSSCIDHVVANHAAMARLGPTRICRVSDLSDHWPISVWLRDTLEVEDTPIPDLTDKPSRGRIPIKQITKQPLKFLDHNYWDALLEAPVDSPALIDQYTESFVKTVENISSELQPNAHSPSAQPRFAFPKALDRLLIEKRLRYHEYTSEHASKNKRKSRYGVYAAAATAARNALRAYQAARWQESIHSGVERFVSSDTRMGWRWLKQIGHITPSRPPNPPLQSPSGELLMDPELLTDRWKEHYRALASDCTGNSMSPSRWHHPLYASIPHPELPINHAITWLEIYTVIKELKKHKASGSDRIPAEVYQLLTHNPPDELEPTSAFARVCWRLWQGMWLFGTVPETWQSAAIVSVPKSGDLTLPDNYRGIALIDVGLKIFSKVIIKRIASALEERKFFIRHQAGFRAKEECIAQVIALRTLIQLRAGQGLPTYACFIDLKKAYDTVPIEALLAKLRFAGVSGLCLQWLTFLYHNSSASARAGFQVSSRFPIHRGVRQGCPMSPTLFNIFINDILTGCQASGATYRDTLLSGLLFADDLVLVANSPADLQTSLDAVSTWATHNEMSFGLSKFGVIQFGPIPFAPLRTFFLLGEPVPEVTQYTYLGVIFTADLDLTLWVQTLISKITKIKFAASHVLSNKDIPIHLRVLVVRALIESRLRYGSALLASKPALCSLIQRHYDSIVKLILGSPSSTNSLYARAPLFTELNLPTFRAIVDVAAVNAFFKYRELKTYVSEFMHHPSSPRGTRLWHTSTRTLINTYGNELWNLPSKARKLIIYRRHEEKQQLESGVAWNRYKQSEFKLTQTFIKAAVKRPDLARGTVYLSRLRLHAWWFESLAVQAKLIPFHYMKRCTMCNHHILSDHISHYLIDCPGHYQARESSMLSILIHRVRQHFGTALTSADISILLLGGSVRGMRIGPSWDLAYPQPLHSATPSPCEMMCQFLQLTATLTITRLWSVRYARL